jgi:DNA topoisomerase-6 subunit B
VTPRSAREVLSSSKLSGREVPGAVHGEPLERLLAALHTVPLLPPSTESLSPIGPMLIKRGLRNVLGEARPDFYAPPVSRPPKVRGGFPFLVEVGLVYGGGLPVDQPVQLLRFANRVPLLFQQGACAITTAVGAVDWRRYGLDQKGGNGLPVGPCVILVHLASTKVPFTSEAKEAVAEDPEIDRELTLALQSAARHLKTHLSRRTRREFVEEKFAIIQKILPKLAAKTSALVGRPVPDLTPVITRIMDVVHLDPVQSAQGTDVLVSVGTTNYTPRARVLELFVEMPAELFVAATFDPTPDGTDGELGRAWWTLPKLAPSARTAVTVKFPKSTEGDAGDLSWYVAGVDESHLLGAEPLPGDWDVRLPRAVIEAAEAGEEIPTSTEETEVDYDGTESKATADEEE